MPRFHELTAQAHALMETGDYGDFSKAHDLLIAAVDAAEAEYGTSSELAQAHLNLAMHRVADHEVGLGTSLRFRLALRSAVAAFGIFSPEAAPYFSHYGDYRFRFRTSNLLRARRAYKWALRLYLRHYGSNDPRTVKAFADLAECQEAYDQQQSDPSFGRSR